MTRKAMQRKLSNIFSKIPKYIMCILPLRFENSILTRDFVYMRAHAISADSDLVRRQATVNL